MCEHHRNKMKSYDFDTKTYKYSEDPEIIRNRKNKSVLIITDCKEYQVPSKSLHPDVSFPEQVKCLSIYCEGDTCEYCLGQPIDVFNNLVLFHNLQYLYVQGVTMEMKYWIEFAQNSKCLKELYLEENPSEYIEYNYFKFTEEALEALFKISTLERVTLHALRTTFFPKGPSNIKELKIYDCWRTYDDEEYYNQFYSSIAQNLCTHTNLEKLNVNIYDNKEMMMNVSECCLNLKELIYESTDMELFEKLLKMPKIEKIKIGNLELEACPPSTAFNFDQKFLTIEYLKIRPEYDYEEDFLKKKYFLLKFKNCCPNLKSLKLYNTKEKEFIELINCDF